VTGEILSALERRIVKATVDMALDGDSGRGGFKMLVGEKAGFCPGRYQLFHQKVSPPKGCRVGKDALNFF